MMTGFSSLDAIVRFVGYQWTKMRGEIEGEMSAVFPEDKIAIMPTVVNKCGVRGETSLFLMNSRQWPARFMTRFFST